MVKHHRIAAVVPALMLSPRGKASKELVTGDGDLVADDAAGLARLDQIKEDGLPGLRELPKPERRAALEQSN
jgi:hypothetical protein